MRSIPTSDGDYFSTAETGAAAWATTGLGVLLLAAAGLATLIPGRPLRERSLRVLTRVVGVLLLVTAPLAWLTVNSAFGDVASPNYGASVEIAPGFGLVAPAMVAICLLVGSRTGAPDGLPEQVR